jgi:hypothetical protein
MGFVIKCFGDQPTKCVHGKNGVIVGAWTMFYWKKFVDQC